MTTSTVRRPHAAPPPSRGVHHLALNTDDMKATIDLYAHVLGMPLVHALRVPRSLSDDAQWLDAVTRHLPASR